MQPLQVALLGRPNAGKSTLFNRLTGASARVGNFPGVTVDILEAEATLPGGRGARLYDLPGLYSLDPDLDASTDERIARDFLRRKREAGEPLLVVQVLDAQQLALGLRLTAEVQRAEPGLPLLVVATQADQLTHEGRTLDAEALAAKIGAHVVATSALEERCREVVLGAIEQAAAQPREATPGWSPDEVAGAVVVQSAAAQRKAAQDRSESVDRVLLHPLLGPLLFFLIMGALFASVFLIADPAAQLFDWLTQALAKALRPRLGDGLLASLLLDGALGGVGTVLAFLPQILVLIALLEVLEASGYLARGAFLVDRLLRVSGLGGKAFVPLLTAHACAVPAISATRVLRDPRERLTTILVLPLMTCSARLPTYTLIVAAFIGGGALRKAAVSTGLYVAGLASGFLAAAVIRRTAARGRGLPLAIEMPTYKRPQARAVAVRCWRESLDFVRRAGTVILAASVLLWALLKIPVSHDASLPEVERSAAAAVGKALEPVSRPLGFDWRINVGLIGSFGARELMVGTLGVIFGVENAAEAPAPLAERLREAKNADGSRAYGLATAASLLAFFVLACQCISTLSAVRRETRSWGLAAFVFAYTYALAYVVSLAVYQIVRWLAPGA